MRIFRVLLFNFFDIPIQTVAGSDHTARDTTKLDSFVTSALKV